jgi:hypothetical protein
MNECGREYPPDAAPLRPPRPTAVLLRPVALRGRVPGRDARFAAFPCAFAPHPPAPLLPQGEKGEFGRPEAQNEKRNAGASKKSTPARRPAAAPLCPAAPCTGAALLRPPQCCCAPSLPGVWERCAVCCIPVRFCPSSPRPPSPTRGEGGVGRPEDQNEKRNAGTSKKPTPARRPAAPLCPAAPCTGAALLRPPPQRSCALPRSAPAPLKTTGAGGGADASTRGFGGRPPWVAAQSGVAPSDTANAALRQPPLPDPTGPSTAISIASPCRSAALRNDNFELSNITHCVKKCSPLALIITHCVMRPSQAVARPCLHRNGAMVCSKGAQ